VLEERIRPATNTAGEPAEPVLSESDQAATQ
jgi:hypothetical protein